MVALAPVAVWAQSSGPSVSPGGVHPAVVRVMATDRDGFSLGSGTLVAVSHHHGLVVTNWHVVREAAGPIAVGFPNGFRSAASVLKTDRDWDLAALAIWRPNVDPVPLASAPPQPGEPLSIAGYGSGQYRTITGRCTQYVAPGYNQPFEMVELSAPARQGDSGGPIFNSRGELAGVLFGTAAGQTSGSYCGRVRVFLTSVRDDFFRLQPNPALFAQQPVATPSPSSSPASGTTAGGGPSPAAGVAAPAAPRSASPSGQIAANAPAPPAAAIRAGNGGWTVASPQPSTGKPAAAAPNANSADPAGLQTTTLWNDIKNYLAVIGVGAVLFHSLKFLTAASRANQRRRYYY